MSKPKIFVAGIGPGSPADITPAVIEAVRQSDVIIGYKYYFQFVEPYLGPGTECIDTGMKKERERAVQAFEQAEAGHTVCMISSGDAGIYGMAPLIMEMSLERGSDVEIEVLPGISAFQKAASLLGAPVGHDFCVISLSDLMTPWETIDRRIRAAAEADFVTAVYNPRSSQRFWQLYRLQEIFLQYRAASTPVGYVRQAGRDGQAVTLTTLGELDPGQIDMFTVIIIGNSQSYLADGRFITPRGYYRDSDARCSGSEGNMIPDSPLRSSLSTAEADNTKPGQEIMIESFKTIMGEIHNKDLEMGHLWALLHAIHTTADFDMENILKVDKGAVETLYQAFAEGRIDTIITDVTMAAAGIRKGALQRLGVQVKCYLSDPRTADLAAENGITRTQAGIRLAVEEHPGALYVFGNAPTALMELCNLTRRGAAHPAGIIAAPVGFVHVRESKHMAKALRDVPKLIIDGRKGGSNLAATLVNAILCYDDAACLKPGRDV